MPSEDSGSSGQGDSVPTMDTKPPPLVALFLIKFDIKVGYTIAWKRSIAHVPLEGVVEYKSLPSGLHNVREDLVYFCHEKYAGVSAFAKGQASQAERNAHLVAVGAMLPLKDGRLGRAWLHADSLMKLARQLVDHPLDSISLENYWHQFKIHESEVDSTSSPQLSPFSLAQRRSRGMSNTTLAVEDKHTLPVYHPARSFVDYLERFGPLVFPLHRAALLRKRILIISPAPIRQACEFVYDLSVSSSTPLSLANSLFLPSESYARLKPLFSVGVHDIPLLEVLAEADNKDVNQTQSQDKGWIACTTDEILAVKLNLYDVVIELPASQIDQQPSIRPVIKTSDGRTHIKATQRDLRRWRMLKRILDMLKNSSMINQPIKNGDIHEEDAPLLPPSSSATFNKENDSDDDDEADVLEHTTWSELAYSSFLWWASAGEKDDFMVEEDSQDRAAVADLVNLAEQLDYEHQYHDEDVEESDGLLAKSSSGQTNPLGRQDARIEMALISYFHHLTRTLFEVSSEILHETEADDATAIDVANIGRDELRQMGLDAWSKNDRDFIRSFVELWYAREINVDRLGIECCGIQVC